MKQTPVQLGTDMWRILAKEFMQTAADNSIITLPEKAQLWAGFMGAAAGHMTGDIGGQNTHAVLVTIAQECARLEVAQAPARPRPDLKVVKP